MPGLPDEAYMGDHDHGAHRDGPCPGCERERNDRGWTDDGHTVVAVVELERVGVRIVCPGEGCKAGYGCDTCNASGYIYAPGGDEQPCPVCDESGRDPKREGQCWLANEMPMFDRVEEFCRDAEQHDVEPGHRIVWRDQGQFDASEPEWKTRGVESYEAASKRRMTETRERLEARRG